MSCKVRLRTANMSLPNRGSRSHILRLRLRSFSKNFQSGSSADNFKIPNPTPVQTLETIDWCNQRSPMCLIRQCQLWRTGRLLLQPEINSYSGSYVKGGFWPIIVSDEVETDTWSKLRDRDFIRNSVTKTRDLKFEKEVRDFNISAIFQIFLNVVITSVSNFFKFKEFFRHLLVVSYLQIQQKKRWIMEISLTISLQYSKPPDLKPSRPRLAKMSLETSHDTES